MIKIIFVILLIIVGFLLLNRPSNEKFQSSVPAPFISYDGLLDGGIQKVTYTYETGDKGPIGEPGEDLPDRNIDFYFESLFMPITTASVASTSA
jgi:hypothetical protein